MPIRPQMAAFATQYQLKFVTGLGDNFYESGIKDLDDRQLVEKFEVIYDNTIKSLCIFEFESPLFE